MMRTVITGTGSFVPANRKPNKDFIVQDFYDADGHRLMGPAGSIVNKFEAVTGICARRYADDQMDASDLAALAAAAAIRDAAIDPETLDQVIVAHNFGNVCAHTIQSDAVPALAGRVKRALDIRNPNCVGYDLLFGCPGWTQGLIQADAFIRAGVAKRCLIIGTETLSRVIDRYDRDSMIFSDGAGAAVVEAVRGDPAGSGMLGSVAQSYVTDGANYIYMGKSCFPTSDPRIRYLKMRGRKVYEFALTWVPQAMKACLEACSIEVGSVKKIFIHQANEKMDVAIVRAFYALFGFQQVTELIMPMNIRELGNSSVATVPTLYDMVRKGALPGHALRQGEVILFASVGAGMNINAVCYRV
jgi:3-oxoacyl-[acyl-carrier-protein] synthase III